MLKEHYNCSSSRNGGQFHLKAIQFLVKEREKKAREIDANETLVAAGIQVCKMKSAATHYESLLSLLALCGVDVGQIGHGRYSSPFSLIISFLFSSYDLIGQ